MDFLDGRKDSWGKVTDHIILPKEFFQSFKLVIPDGILTFEDLDLHEVRVVAKLFNKMHKNLPSILYNK